MIDSNTLSSQELEEQRKATQFKATEARSLVIPPFVPKPSDKALSEISNFTLHRLDLSHSHAPLGLIIVHGCDGILTYYLSI